MNVVERNNVHSWGAGAQPMLLAHGFGCDQNMWRFVEPAFADRYRIVRFDYVGAGGSDLSAYDPKRYASLEGYAQDVIEICRGLELSCVVFVGHSVSAVIGMLAAIAEPSRFARLIHVCPSPCYIRDEAYEGGFTRREIDELLDFLDENYLGWSHAMAPVIMGNPERPELTEELENSFCRTNPEIAKQFARVTFLSDNRADLPRVPTRSLVLQCRQDDLAPPSVGKFVDEHLLDSELTILNATGHCPHLSAPAETIAAMKSFLEAGRI